MSQLRASLLRGIWVPLVTPFRDGEVDHAGLTRLTAVLAADGVAGFVVGGSTGEAALLSPPELQAVAHTVLQAAGGKPVIGGVAGSSTPQVLQAVQAWNRLPLAGLLVSAPSYVKPSQAGIVHHYQALADASALPLLLYDVPARTGVRIATDTMLALAEHPRIIGVKDCSGDPDHLQALLNDGRLAVLCGDDHRIFSTLALGGAGAIAASAHLATAQWVRLQQCIDEGQLDEARRLWQSLWQLAIAVFSEPSPGPVKGVLARRHGLSTELRAPMTPASPQAVARVEAVLQQIERAR